MVSENQDEQTEWELESEYAGEKTVEQAVADWLALRLQKERAQ